MSGFRYLSAEEIGPNLRRLRRQAGLTQAALADKSGRTVERISAIERGKSGLTAADAVMFGEALGVRSHLLLSSDPDWERMIRSAKTPAIRRSLEIFGELIDDYLGLEALVGNPRSTRQRPAVSSLS